MGAAMLEGVIDRIAPTLRPLSPVVGYQNWRDLLFLHWPVPVEVLRPLVPAPLSIDTYDGVAYVGLVPFWMIGVRPNWAPTRSAFRFLETNVRTYTHLDGRDPGVTSSRWRPPPPSPWRLLGPVQPAVLLGEDGHSAPRPPDRVPEPRIPGGRPDLGPLRAGPVPRRLEAWHAGALPDRAVLPARRAQRADLARPGPPQHLPGPAREGARAARRADRGGRTAPTDDDAAAGSLRAGRQRGDLRSQRRSEPGPYPSPFPAHGGGALRRNADVPQDGISRRGQPPMDGSEAGPGPSSHERLPFAAAVHHRQRDRRRLAGDQPLDGEAHRRRVRPARGTACRPRPAGR